MSIDAYPVTMDLSAATDWVREHDDEDDLVADPETYASLVPAEAGIPTEAFIQLGRLIGAQRAAEEG